MNNEDYTAFVINLINVLSFAIGIQNLDMNTKQIDDLQDHLDKQDKQYNEILNKLDKILKKGDNNGKDYAESE